MHKKIVVITGTSSGFGQLAALELGKRGFFVIATMRDLKKKEELLQRAKENKILGNILPLELDVTSEDHINNVVKFIKEEFGYIDILINNAGYSLGGLTEYIKLDEWRKQFETNLFGVVSLTSALIPLMRSRREGKIINIGSISGRIGFPGMGPYAASKFALSGFSEALRLEMLPFNIYVSLIEAGSYKTSIWEKGLDNINTSIHEDYEPLFKNVYTYAQDTANKSSNPVEVVNLICSICKKEKPKFRYPVGKGVKVAFYVKNLLPWSIMEHFIKRRILKNL